MKRAITLAQLNRSMPQTISITTRGRSLIDITSKVTMFLNDTDAQNGIAHLFIQHTSASLIIQENADPSVLSDMFAYFDRIAPENGPYQHTAEGPDDMPAHLKSALTATSLTIPVANGDLMLGTWQGIYLFEHRRAPHTRRVVLSFIEAK